MFSKRIKHIRSLGVEVPSYTNKKTNRINTKPGEHGSANNRGIATQILYKNLLNDKKYIKILYNLKNFQIHNYLKKSLNLKNNKDICSNFYDILELRLDNIVFKAGLAQTIPMARQLINHGFIYVNQQKITKPGFACKKFDIIRSTFLYNENIINDFILTKNFEKIILLQPSETSFFIFDTLIKQKLQSTIEFFHK